MQILTRSECPRCKGQGVVYSPLWREWWKKWERDHMSAEAIAEQPPGPEEPTCLNCHGKGWEDEWLELAEALDRAEVRKS